MLTLPFSVVLNLLTKMHSVSTFLVNPSVYPRKLLFLRGFFSDNCLTFAKRKRPSNSYPLWAIRLSSIKWKFTTTKTKGKNMSNKNVATRYIPIGLMLFALFFGAGNLIFPASMGQNSGVNVWYALIGFCITGVGMPLLAVMAMGLALPFLVRGRSPSKLPSVPSWQKNTWNSGCRFSWQFSF